MEYMNGTDEMAEICKAMIEKFHPHLRGCRFAIISREKAPKSKGGRVWADVSKPSGRMLPLLNDQYDFIICVSADVWDSELDEKQKAALMDHELCHCQLGDNGPDLIGHDLEEFAAVIRRHGVWRHSMHEKIVQEAFLFAAEGNVESSPLRKVS